MQVQTQLSWSERIAATIMQQCNEDGFHAFPSGRWAYVEGMTLMAMARTGEEYNKQEYIDFMKRHMDLYVQPDGSIGTYSLEEYNLDQINQGKNLFALLDDAKDGRYAEAAHLLAAQLAGQPRTSEGGFWHKNLSVPDVAGRTVHVFPISFAICEDVSASELFDEVAHQILLIERQTRDPRTGLLYHGWDESKEQIWADSLTGCPAFLEPSYGLVCHGHRR